MTAILRRPLPLVLAALLLGTVVWQLLPAATPEERVRTVITGALDDFNRGRAGSVADAFAASWSAHVHGTTIDRRGLRRAVHVASSRRGGGTWHLRLDDPPVIERLDASAGEAVARFACSLLRLPHGTDYVPDDLQPTWRAAVTVTMQHDADDDAWRIATTEHQALAGALPRGW